MDDPPELVVADAAAWHDWLSENHTDPVGVWLVLARKGTTERGSPSEKSAEKSAPCPTSLNYAQALDEALCHGWIDGQVRRRDDATFRQRYTPRRSRSPWSQRNVENIARLGAEGRMHPAGLAEVERAKADGRWEAAYAGQAAMEVPDDLAAALAASPPATAMFEILTKQNRYAVLLRIHSAKRADTRERRINQFVEMLARGETVYPQRRKVDD